VNLHKGCIARQQLPEARGTELHRSVLNSLQISLSSTLHPVMCLSNSLFVQQTKQDRVQSSTAAARDTSAAA
jgi:hypothetical protein